MLQFLLLRCCSLPSGGGVDNPWRFISKRSILTTFSTFATIILTPTYFRKPAVVDAKKEKENDTTEQEEAAAAAAKAKADAMARANAKLGIGSGVGGSSAVSANAFASGSNQNSGNVMTGRPTSRVLAPPGGHCSIQLF